jgi:hypothetical protein
MGKSAESHNGRGGCVLIVDNDAAMRLILTKPFDPPELPSFVARELVAAGTS